jgi:hypothetical protein
VPCVVSRREDREWARAAQRIHEAGGFHRGNECAEVFVACGDADDGFSRGIRSNDCGCECGADECGDCECQNAFHVCCFCLFAAHFWRHHWNARRTNTDAKLNLLNSCVVRVWNRAPSVRCYAKSSGAIVFQCFSELAKSYLKSKPRSTSRFGTMCVGVAAFRTRTGWIGDFPPVSF